MKMFEYLFLDVSDHWHDTKYIYIHERYENNAVVEEWHGFLGWSLRSINSLFVCHVHPCV